ncbi:spermidine/putrescine ABC transporter substrate-binding protein [Baekduia soli]|uniref:Spermidine/putrescine ABC transporter substrate-binding protein n=1 Tax=Baekduia soli TaxID=496014 RepID=A0A5B8U796_9ACTN|nr:spermidine/putrescine ABC transporter substrate-binding protein [Baekduia soli]QEC48880.1 spermidine/putrescine ABC transporter substrate-binding protein [Baekduia soli]
MPEPGVERALERLLFEEGATRRRFLGRAGAAGLALSGLAALTGCSIEGEAARGVNASKPVTVRHPRTAISDIEWANWPLYIDKKTLKAFDVRYHAKVRYVEEINDNFEFFGKVRQQLAQGQAIGRDIVTLTDYMAARWVRDGYCEPLDKANIPNIKNLVSNLRSINYDPGRTFTLPWQSGGTGIGYDPRRTGRRLESVNDLFDPAFKGRVTMLSEPYDSACLVLLGMGVDASTAKLADILKAIEKIKQAKDAGQIRRFTGNDYTTDLAKGNVWVAVAYSGDLVQLQADNPALEFVFPKEGAMLFTDNMMMPKHLAHPYAAEVLMNYYYEPQVAAKVAAYVNYISPVQGARQALERTDPKLANNPLIFPPDDVRARLKAYPALNPADERAMQSAMADVTGA